MLSALDFAIGPSAEIALVGQPDAFLLAYRKHYLPRTVIAAGESKIELMRGRQPSGGRPTAFVCENFVCKQPVTDVLEFERSISPRLS